MELNDINALILIYDVYGREKSDKFFLFHLEDGRCYINLIGNSVYKLHRLLFLKGFDLDNKKIYIKNIEQLEILEKKK